MKVRFIIICLLIGITIGLSYYSSHFNPWLTLDECIQNPDQNDGCMVNSFREPMICQLFNDGFILRQSHGPSIRILCDTTNLTVGEYIGLKGIFHKEGYIEATAIQIAENRRYKIWLSTLPVLVIGFLFFKYFHFNLKIFQIELRENA